MNKPAPRNLCVLFGDVAGSTRLYEILGDAQAHHAVDRCMNRMEKATLNQKGRVVKTIGDEVMSAFDSAEAAMAAASEMQQSIDGLPPVSGVKLAIRIGFHYGPAIEERNDVFGDTVNTAARMTDIAKAGQIITSGETVALLDPSLQRSAREIDALPVKGKSERIRVFEMIWQEGADLTMKSGSIALASPPTTRLKLRHGPVELVLGADYPVASLGRDPNSDLIIRDPRASRSHGRIERRREKFVLIDQSTNGTYVKPEGEAEFVLKREEAILRGRGLISFGHAFGGDMSEALEFELLD